MVVLWGVVELYGSLDKKLVLKANDAFTFGFYTVCTKFSIWFWPVWKHPEVWQSEVISKARIVCEQTMCGIPCLCLKTGVTSLIWPTRWLWNTVPFTVEERFLEGEGSAKICSSLQRILKVLFSLINAGMHLFLGECGKPFIVGATHDKCHQLDWPTCLYSPTFVPHFPLSSSFHLIS